MGAHDEHWMRVDPQAPPQARIVHAALILVGTQGLAGVSMSRLAEVAGVSRQTLYNNYPDVESVLAEAVRAHDQEALLHLDSALVLCASPTERVAQLVRHFAALGVHGHSPNLEQGLSAATRAKLAEHHGSVLQRIRTTLEQGIETQEFRADLDPDTDTLLVHGLLQGVQEAVTTRPEDAAAIVAIGTRTALAAVSDPA